MIFDVTISVVPSPKMKSRYASWEYLSAHIEAKSAQEAIRFALEDPTLKVKVEDDKYLQQAIKAGGLQVKAVRVAQSKEA